MRSPIYGGNLYDTGRTAESCGRFLDFLEQGGRTIMQEGIMGRQFHDLYQLETVLKQVPGVEKSCGLCALYRR